jgi:parvulin-like peptidyl-prolyl isomerase
MTKSSSKSKETHSRRSDKRSKQSEQSRQTKKQIAFSRREARQRRIIWLSLLGLALIIVIVLAIGLIQELVIKPAQPIATVNDARIPKDEFEDLLRYRRYTTHITIANLENQLRNIDTEDESNQFLASLYEQQVGQLQANLGALPDEVVEELIEDTLVEQKAEEEGIAVSDDEVTERLDEELQLAAAPPAQVPITDTLSAPTPTPVPQEELDQLYQNVLENMGLSDSDYREILRRGMLREEVQELLASQVVTQGLVAQVQLIKTDAEQQAQAALERIQEGEDFAVVATEVSTDTLTAESGGDVGSVTTGQLSSRYGEEVETAAFDAPVGEPQLVQSGDSFYVILVGDRDENGALPEEVVSRRQTSALADWLEERKASPEVEIQRLLTSDQIPPDPFQFLSGAGTP